MIMFGLIALGIVISTVLLVVLLLSKADDTKGGVLGKVGKTALEYKEQAAIMVVTAKYEKDLIVLRDEITEADDEAIFSAVEQSFFEMRVPGSRLDDHLNTLLGILALKERNDLVVKEEALGLINSLIDKVQEEI